MSYKAFDNLQKHIEIEILKNMSFEDINKTLRNLNEQLTTLRTENERLRECYVKLTNCEYYGEEGAGIKGVYCPNKLLIEFDKALEPSDQDAPEIFPGTMAALDRLTPTR